MKVNQMSTNWYPYSRDRQIHRVGTWLQVFQTKASTWNIPPANVTSLPTADTNAKTMLAVVRIGERTAASVVEYNEAFKEMETEAHFIKKYFLLIPPLTLADLSTPDGTHTGPLVHRTTCTNRYLLRWQSLLSANTRNNVILFR
jgi:hypothetical protein